MGEIMKRRRGKALPLRRQSTVSPVASNTVHEQTLTVQMSDLPIPQRSFHAETLGITKRNNIIRLCFGQFRFGSEDTLKHVVCIDLTSEKIRAVNNSFTGSFLQSLALARSRAGSQIPFPTPSAQTDVNSVCYTAQLIRFVVTHEGEGAIDFYQVPPNVLGPPQIVELVRITGSAAIVDQLIRFAQSLEEQELGQEHSHA